MSELEPRHDGLARFFNRRSVEERTHREDLKALARIEERAAEKIATIHELARENMSQAFLGAAQRNAFIQGDPLGAEEYYNTWRLACRESDQLIHHTARQIR